MEKKSHLDPGFVDARGEIINLFEGRIEHIALITSKKGTVRGNHYHKTDHQYIYLVSGAFKSHSVDMRDPRKRQTLEMKPGDIVETPALIAHAQEFTEDSVFLALTTRQRESGKYEEDTLAYPVIKGYLNAALKKS